MNYFIIESLNLLAYKISLSNSRWYSTNAGVIANVKSKISVSHQHFFGGVIFCAA